MKKLLIKGFKKKITGQVEIPGSKSYTNRALILAALTKNPVKILNPLFSDDTEAMIACLKVLGIRIKISQNYINVIGSIDNVKEKEYKLNAKLSGTTIRFILALCCIVPGKKLITGEKGLNNRPIKDLVNGLRQLGAKIDYLKNDGFPPIKVTSSSLDPGITQLGGDISSQYFSAILMVAPLVGDITLNVLGNQISKPYVNMTIDTMKQFGVKVRNDDYQKYVVKKQSYTKEEYLVEGDYSSAGYFAAIAVLTKSKIVLKNLNPKSKQADLKFFKLLEKMGNKIHYGKNEVIVIGNGVKPMNINMEDCSDQVQTMSVLAAFADGTTKIAGVKSLRIKETERVIALENELKKMGIKTSSTKNALTIYGGDPKPAIINTYGDHRMAMSFAVAGTKLDGMVIKNPDVVSKSFPQFWEKLNEIGVKTIWD